MGPPHGREPAIKDGHDPEEEDPGMTRLREALQSHSWTRDPGMDRPGAPRP